MTDLLGDISGLQFAGMAAAILFAAVLRAFTGFGFAIAALPVLSLTLPPTTAVSVIVLLTLFVSLQTLGGYRRDVPMKDMAGMVVSSAAGTVAGTYLLLIISPDTFRLLIGITVMAGCLALARFKPMPHHAGGMLGLSAGLSSGLMNGALAIPGPPVILYSMAVFETARTSRAFLMGFFLCSAMFATITYSIEGIMGQRELLLAIIAYPVMLIGDKAGHMLFDRYGDATYRSIAIGVCFIIGLAAVIAALA